MKRFIRPMMQCAAFAIATCTAPMALALELLVPAYFYPTTHTTEWDSLVDTARQQPLNVIINPNSGPGMAVNPDYQAVIGDLRAAGATLYGYVSTAWGVRDLNAVTADIDTFNTLYDIDGYFLDEMATGADMLRHYAQISQHIASVSPELLTIANPGTTAAEGYLALFDTLVSFESSAAAFASHVPAPYQASYTPDRFAHLVYGAEADTMASLVSQAGANNVGYLLVTDIDGAGAWEGLPSYWPTEAKAIHAVSAVPELETHLLFAGGLTLLGLISRRKTPH